MVAGVLVGCEAGKDWKFDPDWWKPKPTASDADADEPRSPEDGSLAWALQPRDRSSVEHSLLYAAACGHCPELI